MDTVPPFLGVLGFLESIVRNREKNLLLVVGAPCPITSTFHFVVIVECKHIYKDINSWFWLVVNHMLKDLEIVSFSEKICPSRVGVFPSRNFQHGR